MKKNIFLSGAPSSGKTTVIKKVIAGLTIPANGFYTEEERIGGKRVGFLIKTLDGRKGYLAHEDMQSAFHKALDSPDIVIGTIARGGDDFIKSVRNRGDIEIHEVTPDNRDLLPDLILKEVAGRVIIS